MNMQLESWAEADTSVGLVYALILVSYNNELDNKEYYQITLWISVFERTLLSVKWEKLTLNFSPK